jgi:hypothetical protein
VIRVDEISKVNRLDQRAWDGSLGRHSFYSSTDWLTVAELTADIPPFYLQASLPDTDGVATVPCYPVDHDSPFPLCKASALVVAQFLAGQASLSTGHLASALMPSLFLGGRHPAHTKIAIADRRSAAAAAAVAHALLAHAEAAALERRLPSVGMLYVDADDALTRHVLAERGYAQFAHGAAAVLSIPPAGLDEYVGALAADWRQVARRDIRRLADARVRYEMRRLDSSTSAEVDRLEANLNRKYGGLFQDGAVRKLRDVIGAVLADQTRVAVALMDDQVVGSLVVFRWRDELHARTAGFDYESIGKVPVYFGLLFYYLVDYARQVGVHRIYYSTGTERAKRHRGCRMTSQVAYIRCLDPALHDELISALAGRGDGRGAHPQPSVR